MSDTMHVLLVGGGAREHAMALALRASKRLGTLFITHPENPGLAALGTPINVPVSGRELYRLKQFIEKQRVGLVIIGPEDPLAEGFADALAGPGCLVFGPTKAGAQLESDKAWCKQLLRSAAVPMAEGRVFADAEGARSYFESRVREDKALALLLQSADAYRDPADRRKFIDRERSSSREVAAAYALARSDLPVIKATGLAKGKGVVVPGSLAEALDAIEQIMVRRVHGDAGAKVLIEEKLSGPEVSVLALTDGKTLLVLPPAQDHKRLRDGDLGPNTGGMGAFCPSAQLDEATMERIEREVLVPTLDALRREGIDYRGVLYAGIMLTHAGPKVLEYNCRFGDPECQAILARLESDFLELVLHACRGTLEDARVQWREGPSCCVVLASEGYPDAPKKGAVIHGIDEAGRVEGVRVLHAGTARNASGDVVTAGGRVLNVCATGKDLREARGRAYEACGKISFAGVQLRTDIGAEHGAGRG